MPSRLNANESIKKIFFRLIEIEDDAQRQHYLDFACGDDIQKRRKVRALLLAREDVATNPLDLVIGELGGSVTTFGDDTEFTLDNDTLPETIGRYQIGDLIGEGGMGSVYLAQQREPVHRQVALKLIRAAIATKETVARFEAERQALAIMDHPNIAKVFDGGTTKWGQPYLVMEWVQGIAITQYADEHKMTCRQRLELLATVCRAVQHAHGKGVIHRDIKPSNILVSQVDGAPVPKIIDFGLAKATERPLTEATFDTHYSRMIGTPMYMSPEQARLGSADIDTRSDVYSLGVVLHELLVGDAPLGKERLRSADFDEVRRIIREVPTARPSDAFGAIDENRRRFVAAARNTETHRLRESLRGELDWIVGKAIEKDRDRRYETAAEFADDIRRYLNQEPVRASPPSQLYRMKKLVQRHRSGIAVGTFAIALLIVTSIISIWQVIRVSHANQIVQARLRRNHDLLEAMQLQSAMQYLRSGDLYKLKMNLADQAVDLDVQSYERSLSDTVIVPGSEFTLAKLFEDVSNPLPQTILQRPCKIFDFSINADADELVSVDETGTLAKSFLDDSSMPTRILGSHDEPAHAVAISPLGTTVVSGSTTGHVWLWDLKKERCIRKLRPLETGIESLAWSPDGQTIAAGARYNGVWVANASGDELFRIENDHRHETLLFSPDGEQLYVPTRTKIQVWDVKTGKKIRSLDSSPANVRAMCLAGPDKQWLIVGDRFEESLRILDRTSGEKLGVIATGAAYARSLSVSPDGLWVAAGYSSGRVQLFQLVQFSGRDVQGDMRLQFQAHESARDERLKLCWRDGRIQFVSAGSDGTIALWDRTRLSPFKELRPPPGLNAVLDDPNSGRPKMVFAGQHPVKDRLQAISVDMAEGRFAMAAANQIWILSTEGNKTIDKIESPLAEHLWVEFSRDGRFLFGSSKQRTVMWRTDDHWKTHQLVWQVPIEQKVAPVFADDAAVLISADDRKSQLIEIEVETGKVVREHKNINARVVAVGQSRSLLGYEASTGITVFSRSDNRVLFHAEDVAAVYALRFLSNDRVLISGHRDGTVMAWHIPTGRELGVLYAPSSPLKYPAFLKISGCGDQLLFHYATDRGWMPVILGSGQHTPSGRGR